MEKELEDILLKMRPQLSIETSMDDQDVLVFQSNVLRSILKMLNSSLVILGKTFMPKLQNISDDVQRRVYIKEYLNKNPLITSHIQGMVSGFFVKDEFVFYLNHQVEVNKRIKDMVVERIASNKEA